MSFKRASEKQNQTYNCRRCGADSQDWLAASGLIGPEKALCESCKEALGEEIAEKMREGCAFKDVTWEGH